MTNQNEGTEQERKKAPTKTRSNVYNLDAHRGMRNQQARQPQPNYTGNSNPTSPPLTPNMARGKQQWELRQPTPNINASIQNHLKGYDHTVPQNQPQPAQDPYKQARQIGTQLKRAGVTPYQQPANSGYTLRDAHKAGAALRQAGVQSPDADPGNWQQTARKLEQQMNKNQQARSAQANQPGKQQKQMSMGR